jgi:hypothetical protein
MRNRILAGILITLVIFVVARRITRNRSAEQIFTHGGVTITHMTVFEQVPPGRPDIVIHVSPPVDIDAVVRYREPGEERFESVEMTPVSEGTWSAKLPAREKGERLEYGLRISTGGTREDGSSSRSGTESGFHVIKYKGEVSPTILVLHILCMFAGFFFIVEALIGSLAMLFKGEGKDFTLAQVRWVLLFTFLGGWPLGFALNWQRFGTVWEGFPFGYDVTDNKTQLVFILWLVVAALSWKSFACRRTGRDLAGPRTVATAVIVSSVLSLILYLVPHSL